MEKRRGFVEDAIEKFPQFGEDLSGDDPSLLEHFAFGKEFEERVDEAIVNCHRGFLDESIGKRLEFVDDVIGRWKRRRKRRRRKSLDHLERRAAVCAAKRKRRMRKHRQTVHPVFDLAAVLLSLLLLLLRLFLFLLPSALV